MGICFYLCLSISLYLHAYTLVSMVRSWHIYIYIHTNSAPGAHVEHVLTIHTQRLAYHNHALAHAQSTCIICNPSYPNTTEYSIYIFDLTLANMGEMRKTHILFLCQGILPCYGRRLLAGSVVLEPDPRLSFSIFWNHPMRIFTACI